ncbi:MAG: 7-cyano-7-deazaguanine synthase [Nanoarchaeota archaeon]|nr:7-cyano-7-deazaguanine synthase [Nanoarchaeota archaeon]
MKNAIILCSGGLDSVVTSHYVREKLGYEKIIILFFNYNQKSLIKERKSSKKCAKDIKAKFSEIDLRLLFSHINKSVRIKKIKRKELKNSSKESEKLYVPCRNTLFLVYSLALAESLYKDKKEIYDIFTGFKNEGKESYPDTTPEFVEEMNKLSKISCYKPFKINAPLIRKDKEDIIKLGINLGVNLKDTFSCYNSLNGKHCGYCLACRLRQEGFYWANVKDPTIYKEKLKDFRTAE